MLTNVIFKFIIQGSKLMNNQIKYVLYMKKAVYQQLVSHCLQYTKIQLICKIILKLILYLKLKPQKLIPFKLQFIKLMINLIYYFIEILMESANRPKGL